MRVKSQFQTLIGAPQDSPENPAKDASTTPLSRNPNPRTPLALASLVLSTKVLSLSLSLRISFHFLFAFRLAGKKIEPNTGNTKRNDLMIVIDMTFFFFFELVYFGWEIGIGITGILLFGLEIRSVWFEMMKCWK